MYQTWPVWHKTVKTVLSEIIQFIIWVLRAKNASRKEIKYYSWSLACTRLVFYNIPKKKWSVGWKIQVTSNWMLGELLQIECKCFAKQSSNLFMVSPASVWPLWAPNRRFRWIANHPDGTTEFLCGGREDVRAIIASPVVSSKGDARRRVGSCTGLVCSQFSKKREQVVCGDGICWRWWNLWTMICWKLRLVEWKERTGRSLSSSNQGGEGLRNNSMWGLTVRKTD